MHQQISKSKYKVFEHIHILRNIKISTIQRYTKNFRIISIRRSIRLFNLYVNLVKNFYFSKSYK